MATIIDTLTLMPEEVEVIVERYPLSLVRQVTDRPGRSQYYVVIIEGEREDVYFDFLVDNRIAMSSDRFYSRLVRDEGLSKRMALRIAGTSLP